MFAERLWKALTENSVKTDAKAEDPRLRGRTYVVPFAKVWDEMLEMIAAKSRWTLIRADEGAGLIHAEAKSLLFRFVDDVRIKLKLDQNALTRVDMWSASRGGRGDFGVNRRRIVRWFRDLDRRLGAAP